MGKRIIATVVSLLLLVVIFGLGISLALGYQNHWWIGVKKSAASNQPGLYKITQFYDGDTIAVDMDGNEEKIRMIGVDTPETHDPRKAAQCFGEEASSFTKTLIGNKRVRLESDPTNTNRDRYNRLLRYIYLPDGRLVNLEIIKQGYGFAYLGFPFTKANEFREHQEKARESESGLWSNCSPTENKYGGMTSNDIN